MTRSSPSRGLDVAAVSVGYGRRASVLADITLPALAPGQLVALLGPNGAGKSTLLKALAGLMRHQGRIHFNGEALGELGATRRARVIGYVPQTPPQPSALLAYEFALSALRAAAPDLSAGAAEQRIAETFGLLGLRDQAMAPVSALSGGRRQLLGLAQVVARRTPLVLLDEPTSALDMKWEIEALSLMRSLAQEAGTLCVIALHDINLALRFCDQAVVVANGRLQAAGPTEETITPALMDRTYGVSARIERCSQGQPILLADRAAG